MSESLSESFQISLDEDELVVYVFFPLYFYRFFFGFTTFALLFTKIGGYCWYVQWQITFIRGRVIIDNLLRLIATMKGSNS